MLCQFFTLQDNITKWFGENNVKIIEFYTSN